MRIFITSQAGTKRTRLFLENCFNTSSLISIISKQIAVNKNQIIIKLKYEPYNLIIVDNWALSHYPIRNGSTFIVEFNFKHRSQQSLPSTNPISKLNQDVYQSFYENTNNLSFVSSNGQAEDGKYLEESLNKMLEAIRKSNLETIAEILNQQPAVDDERQLERQIERKYEYLLNELGQYGRNSLHQAIQINNIDIVSYLIIKGSDPTILTVDQFTPIQLAIIYRAPQILNLLLEQKRVNVNQVTAHGTALHLAVSNEEIKCIQILFQNDADIYMKDLDGRRAIDVTPNMELKAFLQNKSEIRRVSIPNITKGNVSNITSLTFKLKNRILVVNPFKNEVFIMKQNNEIEGRFQITLIQQVQVANESELITDGNLLSLRLILKGKDIKQILFGVRHESILNKWAESIRAALQFRQNYLYVKPVHPNQQLIELLNDETNEITLYKRRIQRYRQSRKMSSNLNICQDYEVQTNENKNQRLTLIQTSEKYENFCYQSILQRSQIKLGSIVRPQFTNKKQILQSQQASTVKSLIQSSSQQSISEKQAIKKNQNQHIIQTKSNLNIERHVSFRDFRIIRLVGNGAFGEVYSAKNKKNDKTYALKVLNKKKLMNKKQLRYAVGEVNILKQVDFPFVINLSFAFQTPLNIYMALDSCTYGDLSELIIVKEKLRQDTSRFVVAQIILAIEYLHNRNILYRDLKPENILIASDGYIRLTDFGLSKQDCFSMSFCGSPAYLSPEMLQKNGVGFSADIYGIGCVLYQMVVGQPPFFDQKLQKLFQNIKSSRLLFPKDISVQVKSLLVRLLERDINNRIGVNDFSEIKDHIFFKGFDWKNLLLKRIVPPSEMFTNDQSMKFQSDIQVQNLEQIKLNDTDYDEIPEKMTRIKNFTFVKNGQLNKKEK